MNKNQYKEQLERVLNAQLLLCKSLDTDPNKEPFIELLRHRISELEEQ